MVRLLVGPSPETHSLFGSYQTVYDSLPNSTQLLLPCIRPLTLEHTLSCSLSLTPSFFLALSQSHAVSPALSPALSHALELSSYTMIYYSLIFTFLLMDLELENNLFTSPLQLASELSSLMFELKSPGERSVIDP